MGLNIETGLYIGIGLGVCVLTNYEPLADAAESIVPVLDNRRARHFAFAAVMILWPLWLLYLLLQLLVRRKP